MPRTTWPKTKDNMEIDKSTRHQKIIGDLGEIVVCNWFSRSGFEVTIGDHTGIDILAYNPKSAQRLGVSVKSRTRDRSKENEPVNIFSYQKEKNDRQKVINACTAFACEPWLAVYVECTLCADLYLLSLKHYDTYYKGDKERKIDDWKMNEQNKEAYDKDPEVQHIHMAFSANGWKW